MPRIPPLSTHSKFLHGSHCPVKQKDLLGRPERGSQLGASRSLRIRLVGDRLCRRGGIKRKRGMRGLENKVSASHRVGGDKEGDLNKSGT